MNTLSKIGLITLLLVGCNNNKTPHKEVLPQETEIEMENINIPKPPIRESLLNAIEKVIKESKEGRWDDMNIYYSINFYKEKNKNKLMITYWNTLPVLIIRSVPNEVLETGDITGKIGFIKYRGEYLVFDLKDNLFSTFINLSDLTIELDELREFTREDEEDKCTFDPPGYFYEIINPDSLLFLEKKGV